MIDERQEAIIEEFAIFDEWLDKYQYLIDLGAELEPMAQEHRNERYLIEGCQSRVWVDARMEEDGKVYFGADSDAIITKGIIALLIKVLSGRPAQEIVDAELYFVEQIGLQENLSPTRANGLVSMIRQMKMYALAFAEQTKK